MDGGSFKLDDTNKDKIKAAISKHIASILGQDDEDVLPEYVLVMIANQKSKDQVTKDLEAFLGDQSAAFTNWLWDTLAKFTASANTAPVKSVQSSLSNVKPKQEERGRPEAEPASRNGRDRRNDRDERSRRESPPKSVFASVITVPPPQKRHEPENPATSRLILHAMTDAVKSVNSSSPSPSPSSTSSFSHNNNNNNHSSSSNNDVRMNVDSRQSDYGRERTYRTAKRSGSGSGGSSGGGSVFSRLGNVVKTEDGVNTRERYNSGFGKYGTNSATGGGREGGRESGRIREGGVGGREVGGREVVGGGIGRSENDAVTFTVTLSGVPDEPPPKVGGKRQSMESADDSNMSEVSLEEELTPETTKKVKKERCTYWPNCKRGDECIYIHPSTQCNMFPNCTYGDNCFYIHPSVPCTYGTSCTRADCAFNHPPGRATGGGGGGAAKGGASGVPCKYGYACPREGCTFVHPPEACKFASGCTRPGCHFAHGKPCRFGATCATPGCTFTHGKDLNIPCKFGAACTNVACKYKHDPLARGDEVMVDAAEVSAISATLPPTPPRTEAH